MQIKNCPFCGSLAKLGQSKPSTARFNEGCVHFAVACTNMGCICNCVNLWDISPEEAKERWNKRA